MNEDHVVAAILAAGQIARSNADVQPKDAVRIYQETLAELLVTLRPPRPAAT